MTDGEAGGEHGGFPGAAGFLRGEAAGQAGAITEAGLRGVHDAVGGEDEAGEKLEVVDEREARVPPADLV